MAISYERSAGASRPRQDRRYGATHRDGTRASTTLRTDAHPPYNKNDQRYGRITEQRLFRMPNLTTSCLAGERQS
jgi:hypothetical protein